MFKENDNLQRSLGLFSTVAIIVGAVVGSGIFRKPGLMAAQLGAPEYVFLVWIIAGVITIFGALTNAEIAAMMPETGGQYVYFRRMYGNVVAFLFGWSMLAVVQTGSVASITYVFSEYTEYFATLPRFSPEVEKSLAVPLPFIGSVFPLENIGVKLLTILVVCFLTLVNYLGVRFGALVQNIFTTLKIVAIMGIVAAALFADGGNVSNLTTPLSTGIPEGKGLILAMTAALAGAFWTFDGWNNITFVAGEVQQPQRNIPLGLFFGMIIILTVYMLLNFAYFYILPIDVMAQSPLVAATAAEVIFGSIGGGIVAAAVMISTFGTSNGTILISARAYFAMARDRLFFKSIGDLHPRFGTPGKALVLQCVWTCVLTLSGTFDMLTDMLIFVSWIFYALAAFGIFIFRRKYPIMERPFRTPGYPWVPLFFTLFAAGFVIVTVVNDVVNYMNGSAPIINSLYGLYLVLLGLPLYFFFRKGMKEVD